MPADALPERPQAGDHAQHRGSARDLDISKTPDCCDELETYAAECRQSGKFLGRGLGSTNNLEGIHRKLEELAKTEAELERNNLADADPHLQQRAVAEGLTKQEEHLLHLDRRAEEVAISAHERVNINRARWRLRRRIRHARQRRSLRRASVRPPLCQLTLAPRGSWRGEEVKTWVEQKFSRGRRSPSRSSGSKGGRRSRRGLDLMGS